MRSLLIFSCGTSLTQFLNHDVDLKNAVRQRVEALDPRTVLELAFSTADLSRPFIPIRDLSERVDLGPLEFLLASLPFWRQTFEGRRAKGDSKKLVSAEISTFQSNLALKTFERKDIERIILLGSDTAEGLYYTFFTAFLIGYSIDYSFQNFYHSHDEHQTVYTFEWKDPESDHVLPVQFQIVPSLNAAEPKMMEDEGYLNFISVITKEVFIFKDSQGDRSASLHFITSGGYKATIPVMTQAAIWLSELMRYPTTLTAQFEGSGERVLIPILPSFPKKKFVKEVYEFIEKGTTTVIALGKEGFTPQRSQEGLYHIDATDRIDFSPMGKALVAISRYVRKDNHLNSIWQQKVESTVTSESISAKHSSKGWLGWRPARKD
jgi:hypothetical protein